MSAELAPSSMGRDGQGGGGLSLAVASDSAWADVDGGMEDPEEIRVIFCALDSFSQYAKVAHFNVTHLRRRSFYALPQAHWQLLAAPPFNFLDTLDKADAAIDSNAVLARAILKSGLASFSSFSSPTAAAATTTTTTSSSPPHPPPSSSAADVAMPYEWAGIAKFSDIDKARSTIRQFYRDWSAAGAAERAASYGPVLAALEQEAALREAAHHDNPTTTPSTAAPPPTNNGDAAPSAPAAAPSDPRLKVLVPGAGLGRLVFELCLAGHHAEGNEISYHQLLASSYILNDCPAADHHAIYPWIHTFSNHLLRDHHLRAYPVPDVHPATALAAAAASSPRGAGSMAMCAADFLCLYADAAHADAYDAVASVFFLDTAPNLLRYLEVLFHCLRPGGLLVNLGPLLWHFENNAPGNHGHDDDGDGEHDLNSSSGIADPGSFELSNDEVLALVEKVGFVVERMETGIDAPYIQDRESMLQTVYKATFWVARKPLSASVDQSA
ncbi:UPF0586 protein [Escovopsis weberi]|uniref:carnosine N-methyltransferase n=1 Tax=Escovopsis weberi TaxID=150374 RepID=A0A0M8N0E1_ESCWE|nr:UPF0586 protein [Escovopsis weberi]